MKTIIERKNIVLNELEKIEEFVDENNLFKNKEDFSLKNRIKLFFNSKENISKYHVDFFKNYIELIGEFIIGKESGILKNRDYRKSFLNNYKRYKTDCKISQINYLKINSNIEKLLEDKIDIDRLDLYNDNHFDIFCFFTGKQIGCNNIALCLNKDIYKKEYCYKSFKLLLNTNKQLLNKMFQENKDNIQKDIVEFYNKESQFLEEELKNYNYPYLGNAYWNFDVIGSEMAIKKRR
tara:strand:- start:37085 stop:37792 length:708 start_codon:yes stop_codon:yes gene_type:complete